MKTERPRSKRVITRRRLRSLFVNKRRPHYSLEFKLRTLPNLLKFEGNLTPWLLLPLPPVPHLLETHLTLVTLELVVKETVRRKSKELVVLLARPQRPSTRRLVRVRARLHVLSTL